MKRFNFFSQLKLFPKSGCLFPNMAHLISLSPLQSGKFPPPSRWHLRKRSHVVPAAEIFPWRNHSLIKISSASDIYLNSGPAPVIVVTVVSSSLAASPNSSRTCDVGGSCTSTNITMTTRRWGNVYLVVHVVVEGVELVGPVEGDASEAGMLCDSDRWVGEDGGDGGGGGWGGGGGEGAERADHCSAVITEYSVVRPGYIIMWKEDDISGIHFRYSAKRISEISSCVTSMIVQNQKSPWIKYDNFQYLNDISHWKLNNFTILFFIKFFIKSTKMVL